MNGIVAVSLAPGAFHTSILEALHREIFNAPWDQPWSAKAFAEVLAMKGAGAWLSMSDQAQGAPNGFAILLVADQAELLSMGVLPAARRQGHGSRLLGRVCAEAAGQGATRIFLEHASDNLAAAAFYAQAGFVAGGRRKDYYRGRWHRRDALILVKDLNQACLGSVEGSKNAYESNDL